MLKEGVWLWTVKYGRIKDKKFKTNLFLDFTSFKSLI